jgi:hypothetical protein
MGNGEIEPRMDADGRGWTRMDADGRGWTRMDADGRGWTRMGEMGFTTGIAKSTKGERGIEPTRPPTNPR